MQCSAVPTAAMQTLFVYKSFVLLCFCSGWLVCVLCAALRTPHKEGTAVVKLSFSTVFYRRKPRRAQRYVCHAYSLCCRAVVAFNPFHMWLERL